jgi:K+-sensing histidine kinase KdpD
MKTPIRRRVGNAAIICFGAAILTGAVFRFDLSSSVHAYLHQFDAWNLGDVLASIVLCAFAGLTYALWMSQAILRNQRTVTRKVLRAHTHAMEIARDEAALARENAELANDAKTELYHRTIQDLTEAASNMGAKLGILRSQLGNLSGQEAQLLVDDAVRSVGSLYTLVADLERANVLQRSALVTSWEPINLVDMLDTVIENIAPLGAARGIRVHFAPGMVARHTVKGQSDRLTKALVEVLLNAVARSPKGGRVIAEVVGDRLSLIIRIIDEGPHISSRIGKRLFDTYGIDPSSIDPGREGEAMNLQAAQSIVERHKGKISFENLPRAGVCFMITIPTYQPSAAEAVDEGWLARNLSPNGI